MELSHCDGGRYDGAILPSDYSPGCALRDDSSGGLTSDEGGRKWLMREGSLLHQEFEV